MKNSHITNIPNEASTNKESIGQIISRAREEQVISLIEASAATKLKTAYLQAIEHDDFEELPAPIYAKNFIRIYANFLGLNGVEVSNKLGKQMSGIVGLPPKKRLSPTYYVASFFNLIFKHPLIFLGAVVVFLILFFYPGGSSDQQPERVVEETSAENLTSLDDYKPVYDLSEPLPRPR